MSGAASAAPADAAPAAPPASLFFQRPTVLEARLSPSGHRLAVTSRRDADHVGLIVIELGPKPVARRVAQYIDADVRGVHWVGEDRLVYSVVDLNEGSGEDRFVAPGLFVAKADGSGTRALVQRRGRPFVTDGSDAKLLDWNHVLLMVPQAQEGVRPDEVLVGRRSGQGGELESVTPIWLNVVNGRTRDADLGEVPSHAQRWWFDSRGEARALSTVYEGRVANYWRGPGEKAWRRLSDAPLLRQPFQIVAVDDAGTLYVQRDEGPAGLSVLARFDLKAMAPARQAFVVAPGFDVWARVIERAGEGAIGVRVETDTEHTYWFDQQMKRFQQEVDERFADHVNRIECVRCGTPEMVALVRSTSDRDPGGLWVYDAKDPRWQRVSENLPGVDPGRMASVAFERIHARDGRDLPVWLTVPPGVDRKHPAPAVVLVHGGPWVRIGHWRWQPMEQFLASRGYLVISPEFRGSAGYGQAHGRAGWKQWGQAMQDDVADALLWARREGLAGDRACIAGGSYGGYATLMGLVRHPDLYRCGVAWVAVADLELYVKGSWWIDDDISDAGRRYNLPEMVGDIEKDGEMLRANSPLVQARRIQAPLLLAYGEVDRRVPLAHGKRLREALIDAGHPPEWVTYANEGHSWRQISTWVDFAERMDRFLARHLKDPLP